MPANWKEWLYGIAIVTMVWSGWWMRGKWDETAITIKVNAATQAAQKQCADNQRISEGVQHDLQTNLDTVQRKLDAQRLQPHPVCVPTHSEQPNAVNGTGHAEDNGIRSEWLFVYAARCENYRLTVNACQTFLKKERGQ